MPMLSKAFRGRFVAGASQPRANRESCDISLMTAAQLIPQSDCAELHQVDVTSEVLDCYKTAEMRATDAGWLACRQTENAVVFSRAIAPWDLVLHLRQMAPGVIGPARNHRSRSPPDWTKTATIRSPGKNYPRPGRVFPDASSQRVWDSNAACRGLSAEVTVIVGNEWDTGAIARNSDFVRRTGESACSPTAAP